MGGKPGFCLVIIDLFLQITNDFCYKIYKKKLKQEKWDLFLLAYDMPFYFFKCFFTRATLGTIKTSTNLHRNCIHEQ